MKTIVTETGSVYELSDVGEDGYVFVRREGDDGTLETIEGDTFPMRAKVNGYDVQSMAQLDDIAVGYSLQILPAWRHESNMALGPMYIGIVTSPVAEVS